jgi:hypothetical protein
MKGLKYSMPFFYSCAYIREVLEVLGSVQRILDTGRHDEAAGNAREYVKSVGGM